MQRLIITIGNTTLHHCALLKKTEFFEIIVEKTQNYSTTNHAGRTPIAIIAYKFIADAKRQDYLNQKIIVDKLCEILQKMSPDLVEDIKKKTLRGNYKESGDEMKIIEEALTLKFIQIWKELQLLKNDIKGIERERKKFDETQDKNKDLKEELKENQKRLIAQNQQLLEKTTQVKHLTKLTKDLNDIIEGFNKRFGKNHRTSVPHILLTFLFLYFFFYGVMQWRNVAITE